MITFRLIFINIIFTNYGMAQIDVRKLSSIDSYQEAAKNNLNAIIYNYISTSSLSEFTQRLNSEAFLELLFRQENFVDVSVRDMSTTIFGEKVSWPVGMSPTCCSRIASYLGEIDSAKAAEATGSIFTLGSLGTTSIEDVAAAAPNAVKWMQTYVYKNHSVLRNIFQRAERNGFKAIVLTLDSPVYGLSRNHFVNDFNLPKPLTLPNLPPSYLNYTHTFEHLLETTRKDITPTILRSVVSMTKLPVVAKGILTREAAIIAKNAGCKGIIVSTHGGRQLDGSPASIQALPEIVEAVGREVVVMLDSGVRGGPDVLKALALGAKYVMMGRPIVYGLATNGQKGVEGVLNLVRNELDSVMGIIGAKNIASIKRSMVVHKDYYKRLAIGSRFYH